MKNIAIIAALAASIAAPAVAQSSSTAFAIAHFNMSADNLGETVALPGTANSNSGTLSEAYSVLNQSADTATERRGVAGATDVSAESAARAREIFARLRAESLENE